MKRLLLLPNRYIPVSKQEIDSVNDEITLRVPSSPVVYRDDVNPVISSAGLEKSARTRASTSRRNANKKIEIQKKAEIFLRLSVFPCLDNERYEITKL